MTKYTYYCIGRVACHAVLIGGIVLVFADWSSVPFRAFTQYGLQSPSHPTTPLHLFNLGAILRYHMLPAITPFSNFLH